MINTRHEVNDAFGRYKTAVEEAGYEVTGEDNEGFEAEVFFKDRSGQELGAIQIRMSRCDDASIVFVQIVDRRFLG